MAKAPSRRSTPKVRIPKNRVPKRGGGGASESGLGVGLITAAGTLGLFLVVLVMVGRERLIRPWTWFRKGGAR